MRQSRIGKLKVSGLCLGSNPFSGYSHQTPARDRAMLDYYTPERIKRTLRDAEAAGINTVFARTDARVIGILREYFREGGALQWFAQVCSGEGNPDSWRDWLAAAVDAGCAAAYLHGGQVDFWYANGAFDVLAEALDRMRAAGVAAGLAAHKPEAHEWIRDHLDVDFQMCSHYNPTDRSKNPKHSSVNEKWEDEDRGRMLEVIQTISRPVVHYKVFAGGNKPVVPAFKLLGRMMRADDVVCVGMFTQDDPDMVRKNVALFEEHVEGTVALA